VAPIEVRPLEDADREWSRGFLRAHGSETVAVHGELFAPTDLPGLVAWDGDERVALLTYRLEPGACEVLSLHSDREGIGAGTALLEEAARVARAAGSARLWLITSNDNTHAFRFYQRRGFRLAVARPGAVDELRRTLKPAIPEIGNDGIPIRDELELELPLEG
jgi:ribosomal protein S18 acetylase RimI-like enzyme